MLSERPRGSLSETRKVTKSAMEKKRRARINTSLVELKTILGGMLSHKTERFDKMEKADILEMTVRYVKQLQRKSEQLSSPAKTKDEDYKNGVNSCISEVIKYIASSNSCDDGIKAKLLDHLANRLTGVDETSVRQECKTALSTSYDREPPSSPAPSVPSGTPAESNSIQTPISLNTQTVCPTAIALSPGSNIQGQLTGTALQASPVMNAIQQTSPVVSNIPLTIIVPANLYSSVSGTACVIPLSLPTTGSTPTVGTLQIPTVNDPPNIVSDTLSPVTNGHSDTRTVLGGQQHTLCLNNGSLISNVVANPDNFSANDFLAVPTNKVCNSEMSGVLKENFAHKSHDCRSVQYSPDMNSLRKEPLVSDQLWRPW